MQIRPAEYSDITPLALIFMEVYNTLNVGEFWISNAAEKLLNQYFTRCPDLAFVAHEQNELLGAFFADVRPWCDGNHLIDGELFVQPNAQRRGIGTRLIETMLKEAVRRYDVVKWDATTFADRQFPLSLYKKLGFEPIGNLTLISGDIKNAIRRIDSPTN